MIFEGLFIIACPYSTYVTFLTSMGKNYKFSNIKQFVYNYHIKYYLKK